MYLSITDLLFTNIFMADGMKLEFILFNERIKKNYNTLYKHLHFKQSEIFLYL